MKPCFTILVGLINTRFRPNHTLSRNQNSSLKTNKVSHQKTSFFFLVCILKMPTSIPKFKITKSVDLPSNDEYITDPKSLFFNKLHPFLIYLSTTRTQYITEHDYSHLWIYISSWPAHFTNKMDQIFNYPLFISI